MKISLKWINDFIKLNNIDSYHIEKELTDLGLECNIVNANKFDPLIVIGKVLDVTKHPNADKLKICTVDVGDKNHLKIICGAPNVKANIIVPVAKVESKVGDIKISKAKIRGVHSFGMICSGKELNINDDHEGIMIFDSNSKIGISLNEFLNNDTIIDIDLTPNRGDCFSHLGVAREIATFINNKLKYNTPKYKSSDFKTSDMINIKIDENICSRYSAILIKNISVVDSPKWIKERLNGIGCKSINNIVDLANYIMYDLGQPLHAFDYDKIKNKKVYIKLANQGQKINTINDVSIKLNSNDIIISDDSNPLAVAGIIGGSNSHVTDNTKNILLESAVFNDIFIRRSSKWHDISTESSKRFERGVDPENVIIAMKKFVQLLQEISDCNPSLEYVDIYPNKIKNKKIKFDLDSCNKYLGSNISINEFKSIFKKLLIEPTKNNLYKIPSYRNDLENEIDLYEEIARVYGYNNIIANPTFVVPYKSIKDDNQALENSIRESLANNGFNEHYSNSLYSQKDIENSNKKAIKLKNPISTEFEYLRNDMVPGLLKAVSYNLNRNKNHIKIFEIGNIQIANKKQYNLCSEERQLSVVWAGNKKNHWKYPGLIDIYTVKGQVDLLLNNIGVTSFDYIYSNDKISININSTKIGEITILNADLLNKYDIEEQVIVFILSIDYVKNILDKKTLKYKRTSQYPGIKRDISIIVSSEYNNIDLEKNIFCNGGEYLMDINLFDYYVDKKIASDKKSLAYSLEFRSHNRTLKDSEINFQMDKIIGSLVKKFNVIQR